LPSRSLSPQLVGKGGANERKQSSLFVSRVQPVFAICCKDSKKKGKPRKIKRKSCEMEDFAAAPKVFPNLLTEKVPAGQPPVSADLLIRCPNEYKHLQMRHR